MIEYHYELDFRLGKESDYSIWIEKVTASESGVLEHLNYVFCGDDYLWKLNRKYLNHNTLTDILTFDYSQGRSLKADIVISVERVRENAKELGVGFDEELLRVMAHGVLHLLGYGDRTDSEKVRMRDKEDEKIKMFHVEQQ
ncbi:MAG: rRNA maturation RNase YbeY [Aurantibacter sp.]